MDKEAHSTSTYTILIGNPFYIRRSTLPLIQIFFFWRRGMNERLFQRSDQRRSGPFPAAFVQVSFDSFSKLFVSGLLTDTIILTNFIFFRYRLLTDLHCSKVNHIFAAQCAALIILTTGLIFRPDRFRLDRLQLLGSKSCVKKETINHKHITTLTQI